jgi:hypothetical protein
MKEILSVEMISMAMTLVLQVILIVALVFAKKYGLPAFALIEKSLKEKMGESTYNNVRNFIQELVKFVESKYADDISKMGKQKKQEVLNIIKKQYPEFDEVLLDAILENAVKELKRYENEHPIKAPPEPTTPAIEEPPVG